MTKITKQGYVTGIASTDTSWSVLVSFGYDDDLMFNADNPPRAGAGVTVTIEWNDD